MLFRMRSAGGAPFRAGTWIDTTGATHALTGDDIELEPLSETQIGAHKPPVRWRIKLPRYGLQIETAAVKPRKLYGDKLPLLGGAN